jgi:hypothetical protein
MAVVGARANVGSAGIAARPGRLTPAGRAARAATPEVLPELQLFRAEETAGVRRARGDRGAVAGIFRAEETAR